MKEAHLSRREFRLRYDDVDSSARAKPVTVLNLLEEAASSHCDESGWGVFRLMEEGFGWVLLRGGFEMKRYPRYREEVSVETWVSSARRFSAEREYRILSAEGEEICSARSLWLFFDIGKKRPASIFQDILEAWTPGGSPASDLALDEIDGPDPSAVAIDFPVRRSDIDTNGHVNNVVYLAWALEALPAGAQEGSMLRRIQGQFKRELTLGITAKPRCKDEGDGRLRLGVYGEPAGGEPFLAAAAETLWVPRPAERGEKAPSPRLATATAT
jgi:acyl-ACP thioesterase